jgi:hypothetical protein
MRSVVVKDAGDFVLVRVELSQKDGGIEIVVRAPCNSQAAHDRLIHLVFFKVLINAGESFIIVHRRRP